MDTPTRRVYHEKVLSPFSSSSADPFKPAVVLQKSQSSHPSPTQSTPKQAKPIPSVQPPSPSSTSAKPTTSEAPKSAVAATTPAKSSSNLDLINSTINSHGTINLVLYE